VRCQTIVSTLGRFVERFVKMTEPRPCIPKNGTDERMKFFGGMEGFSIVPGYRGVFVIRYQVQSVAALVLR
jgi:hypothetical protein